MGFSGIFGSVIMFLAVITISLTLITSFNNMANDTSNSIQIQGKAISNSLKTNLFFDIVKYENDEIIAYIKNTGSTNLQLDKIDFYIDGIYISRNDRSLIIESSTDIKNPGIFDPGEILKVKIDSNLVSGMHTISLTTQYSFKTEELFSVG